MRVRAKAAAGIDRVVLVERWLAAADWQQLTTVWTYDHKPVVVQATGGYSYALPSRLALAHPCRWSWLGRPPLRQGGGVHDRCGGVEPVQPGAGGLAVRRIESSRQPARGRKLPHPGPSGKVSIY